uniref:BPTI/Kunitz inhibitor domain-containing protein n=1 Tax=Strongyloides stercoralis TaxID=6248 RepID=A0A913HEF1_STRER
MNKKIFIYIIIYIINIVINSAEICRIGDNCNSCEFIKVGDKCHNIEKNEEALFCDSKTNKINILDASYLECDSKKNVYVLKSCYRNEKFIGNKCQILKERKKRQGISGSGRVGDFCSFNTDCLAGMFCSTGTCACLSNFVAIQGYCYLKKNPGESGCQYSEQCSAIWPESRCEKSRCICPEDVNGIPYVMSKTRDGVVCILHSGEDTDVIPKCPLPEYDDDLLTMPVSQLRNPAMTDPDDHDIPMGDHINPLQFCNSKNTDYTSFLPNGGGACVYGQEPFTPGNGIYIGDIYDCIGAPTSMSNVKSAMEGIYDIHSDSDGICCPSRAFTCIQPKREADSGSAAPAGVRPRWWFNSVTGNCEQFMWDPWDESELQSSNNFKTREHCESYCLFTCKRGAPQYISRTVTNEDEPINNCQSTGTCGGNFECTSIGSMQLCCPTVSSICSNSGGRPMDLLRTTNFDPGYTMKRTHSLNFATSSRYYYDAEQGRCIPFTYNGAFGSFNNFKSSAECELFCAKLQCSYGSPLKIGSSNQKCSSNAECPSSHDCNAEHGVCCPRPQTICSQPLRLGDCKQSIRRFYYNAISKACENFEYTGCQGNDNNFETLLDCQNTCENISPEPQCPQGDAYKDYQGNYYACSNSGTGNSCPVNFECYFDNHVWGCCPTKAYTCSLPSHKGVQCGSGSSYRYYYDSQNQECASFKYNGCDGNSNNFATREECESYCGVANCPNGGTPHRNEFGQLTVCSVSNVCPSTHECTVISSGSSVVNRCCPTRNYICSLPPQQGSSCSSSQAIRYYFNIVTKECSQFTFNGCNGNLNNWVSLEQCNSFCRSSACSPGDIAYVNPNTNLPYECNPSLINSCPGNFQCTYDQLTGSSVCCGASGMDVCPDGEKAFVNAADNSVRECLVNVEGSCPSNYLCRFNSQKNRYYCCSNIKGDLCPQGKSVFRDIANKNPMRCTIGGNQCSSGYSCQSTIPEAFQGYCCSNNHICPDKGEFFIEESSQMPRSCTIGAFITCPNGYSCQQSVQESNTGYCCKGEIVTFSGGCPPNEYVYMKDNEIASCDPFNPSNAPCPPTYTCQWSKTNMRYQCCSSTVPIQQSKSSNVYTKLASLGCPNNQIAYKESGNSKAKICTAGGSDCPLGYFCLFIPSQNQYQCCGSVGGCPNNSVAFIGMSGEPQECSPIINNCPYGFGCIKTSSGLFICCTIEEVKCSKNEVEVDEKCLPKVNIDEKCIDTKQCPESLVCFEDVCKCPPNMVMINGNCKSSCPLHQIMIEDNCYDYKEIEDECKYEEQCKNGSVCDDGVCLCPEGTELINGICKKSRFSSKPSSNIQINGICPILGHVPLTDLSTNKIRYCNPGKNTCPKGFSCQWSPSSQRNICCGKSSLSSNSLSSGNLRLSKNTKVIPGRRNVCLNGSPYLLNGLPQSCSKSACPSGFKCSYSRKIKQYFCCSNEKRKDINGCPNGTYSLLFPSTGTPVQCSNMGLDSCPSGYQCTKSLKSNNYQCCSEESSRRYSPSKNNGGLSACPPSQVQVSKIQNNRIIKKCLNECPKGQIAVKGICHEALFNDDPLNIDIEDVETNDLFEEHSSSVVNNKL